MFGLGALTVWLTDKGLPITLLVLSGAIAARFVDWVAKVMIGRIDSAYRRSDALVRSEPTKHRHSMIQVVSWCVVALIYMMVTLKVLALFDLPLRSLVAPATVIGAALGFGAQRIVQDILAGFLILAERQYSFGDEVQIAIAGSPHTTAGTVEDVTLRVTRLRNAAGEMITVPNGQIATAVNLSRDWARVVIDVPIPAAADLRQVDEILQQVNSEAFADHTLRRLLLDEPTVTGVESLEVEKLSLRVVARTLPGKQFDVGRALRARIAAALRSRNITVTPLLGAMQATETVDLDEPAEPVQ